MARIRSIKPEILEDEKSAALSSDSWRLWVSMWLLADDHGNLRGESRRVAASVFWAAAKQPDLEKLLRELESLQLIQRYTVRGQSYIHICNWTKHQRIDNAGKTNIPPISDADEGYAATRGEIPRDSAVRRSDLDLDLEGNRNRSRSKRESLTVLESLNEARKRSIPGSRELRDTEENLKHILERLDGGATVDECLYVIAVCESEVKAGGDPKWFDQVTPFRKDNFAKRLAMVPGAKHKTVGMAEPMPAQAVGGEVKL